MSDYCYFDPFHGRFIFEFLDEINFTMNWQDDISWTMSKGYYYITDSSINFATEIRPDSVRISLVFDSVGNSNNSYNEYIQKDNLT